MVKIEDLGYQDWSAYQDGENDFENYLNLPKTKTSKVLKPFKSEEMYLYTQHQIYYREGILQQTRSSPNFEGGIVTYSTCKHNMRTYNKPKGWAGIWIGGLCPAECERNCLLFVGRVAMQHRSNYGLGKFLKKVYPYVWRIKQADTNPRGDIYTPKRTSGFMESTVAQLYDHNNFEEPPNHTRSTEFYKKSPGSVSEREDGKIPKWWRDIEYLYRSRRPPSFILSPCLLFNKPVLWSGMKPGRACLRITVGEFINSLRTSHA